ncbi:MAG: TRAP transporter small permease subunit [Alphaproteobacteria bacterium]
MLRLVAAFYSKLIAALAMVAGVAIAVICVAIIIDVGMASSGLRPPIWVGAGTEYALLYLTLLSSPWLLRQKGHVTIAGFRNLLRPAHRIVLEKFIYLLALIVMLVLTYFGLVLTWETIRSGNLDIRSFEFPRWLVYLPMPIGFGLLAIEFSRLLFGHDSLYDDQPVEGL